MKGRNDRSGAQASAHMPQRLESQKESIALTSLDNRVCELVSSDCVFFAVKDIEEGAVGSSCAVVTANNKHKVLKLANTSLQDTILKDTKRCNQY